RRNRILPGQVAGLPEGFFRMQIPGSVGFPARSRKSDTFNGTNRFFHSQNASQNCLYGLTSGLPLNKPLSGAALPQPAYAGIGPRLHAMPDEPKAQFWKGAF